MPTVRLNTFHTWIETEAPLRGNWSFQVPVIVTNLTCEGKKDELQSFVKTPWRPEFWVQFVVLLKDRVGSAAGFQGRYYYCQIQIAQLLVWLMLAWADGYLINKMPETAIAVFWRFYYVFVSLCMKLPLWVELTGVRCSSVSKSLKGAV